MGKAGTGSQVSAAGSSSGSLTGRLAVLHRGGKHDLRAGTAKLLQMVDKGIQLLRGAKQHFNQHAVIASHAVALHNIAAALDVGVKLRLELGVHIQVDERLDQLPQLEPATCA